MSAAPNHTADRQGPGAWLSYLAAAGLAVLGAGCALALATRPEVGAPGVWSALAGPAARLLVDGFGLASWWLPICLGLGALLLGLEQNGRGLLPMAVACLWLLLASATLLGLAGSARSSFLPGGLAGLHMALDLRQGLGPAAAWSIAGGLEVLGLLLTGWLLWRPLAASGLLAPPRRATPAKSPAPTPPPVRPPRRKVRGRARQQGPRIKPRLAPPAPAAEASPASAGPFKTPPLKLLNDPPDQLSADAEETLKDNSVRLESKLRDFGVQGQVNEVAPGPVVTMYEFKPAPGVKISKVAGLADDLAMSLKAHSIRIVAPIPGKAVIGVEIPSAARETVYLRELLASSAFQKAAGPLVVALGKDILGQPVVNDLDRMPHLLIAGATGSGKSVFINCLVLSLLYRATPDKVRLIMVDPKRIELSTYNDIPHLLHPIITQPKEATAGLRWALAEMERRYSLLAALGVRSVASFNRQVARGGGRLRSLEPADRAALPYIVLIIDELSDLMMVSSKEVEALVIRLAQMARAAGIHLVLATQRPSVDVITGLIKANFPARISFQVSSRVDSRTILDVVGAERLLGLGDMLFMPPGTSRLTRLHGAFVSDREIEAVVGFLKAQAQPEYDESIVQAGEEGDAEGAADGELDEFYQQAVEVVRQSGQASISYLQRRLRVGYNRAARMIEQMEREGIVGPSDGSRPRQVLPRD